MSSTGGPRATTEDAGIAPNGNGSQDVEALRNMEGCSDGEVHLDPDAQDSNSSTSSNSSMVLGEVQSAVELPVKRLKNSSKKFKHHPYKMPRAKRRSKAASREEKSTRILGYNNKYQTNDKTLEITPERSTEHVPGDCYQFKEVGNLSSQDPFACSLYITSYDNLEDHLNMQISIDPLADTLCNIASGKIRIQKTCCGIIAAFTKEDDADKIMKLPLQNIFHGPVQLARFQTGECKFRKNVIIKDVPWCISNLEIHQALKKQGITAGKVIRTRAYVKIEVLSSLDMHRLVEEGLNFFNYTSFPAVPDNNVNQGEPDIIQCFKCQGFWHTSTHCRQMPRCVRCGENHDVEYCPRPRNAPVCCHCGGPHHAAFKMCPVRLQHINSTYVGFQLTKCKPLRSLPHNIF